MMLNEKEKLEVQNLLKLIRRAEFKEFQGVEALALARAYHWLESLVAPPKPVVAPAPVAPKPVVASIVTPLMPIEDNKIQIIPAPEVSKEEKAIKKAKKVK